MRELRQVLGGGSWFNPHAHIEKLDLGDGQRCIVVDQALREPELLVDWADQHLFAPSEDNSYPGLLLACPPALYAALADFFLQHVRASLGGRRTIEGYARFSLATLAAEQLRPCQWLCHRDRVAADPNRVLFAASVLYLFREPSLGGTAFYRPRCSETELQALLEHAQLLDNREFAARYGLKPGYQTASNPYFELRAVVPAAWNRMIFYDGGQFHSAQIEAPERLSEDPRQGRLSLNGFFACSRPTA